MTAETHWQRKVKPAASTDVIDVTAVDGDADDRFTRDAAGKMEWGNGTDAVDTNLYRDSANVLKTDDAFTAGLGLRRNVASVSSGGACNPYGLNVFGSSTTASFTLSAPNAVGDECFLHCTSGTSLANQTLTSAVGINNSTTNVATFSAVNQALHLIAQSTSLWRTAAPTPAGTAFSS